MNLSFSELFKYNRSTFFLLGTVGLSVQQIKKYGLCNCYLRDKNKPEYEDLNVLLLLFEVKNRDTFRFFVEKEKVRTALFIDEYDYEDGYVVLVYEIPEKFSEDLEKFYKGQFSKFSKELIDTIPKQNEVIVEGVKVKSNTIQYRIIHKDEEFKNMIEQELGYEFSGDYEIWTIPDQEEESITIPPKKRI